MEKVIDIKKDVVSFQQSIDLCMIGFNEKTLCAYEIENQELYLCHIDEEGLYMPEKDMPAPLRSQVFRWFREKYEIHGFIIHYSRVMFRWCIDSGDDFAESIKLDTYEEAENACIDELIKIAKQQK